MGRGTSSKGDSGDLNLPIPSPSYDKQSELLGGGGLGASAMIVHRSSSFVEVSNTNRLDSDSTLRADPIEISHVRTCLDLLPQFDFCFANFRTYAWL